jgi:hypothetical protein
VSGEAIVMIPFTIDLLESMEDRWSPPVRWRAVQGLDGWSIEIRGADLNNRAETPQVGLGATDHHDER